MVRVSVAVHVEEVRCSGLGCKDSVVPEVQEVQRVPAQSGHELHARAVVTPPEWSYLRFAGRAGDLCPRCTRKVCRALVAAGVWAP